MPELRNYIPIEYYVLTIPDILRGVILEVINRDKEEDVLDEIPTIPPAARLREELSGNSFLEEPGSRDLFSLLERYERNPGNRWHIVARQVEGTGNPTQRLMQREILKHLLSCVDDPARGYDRAVSAVEDVLTNPPRFLRDDDYVVPPQYSRYLNGVLTNRRRQPIEVSLSVPMEDGEERRYPFYYENLADVPEIHTNLEIFGPNNSGKSSLVSSIANISRKEILPLGVDMGVISEAQVQVMICDIDPFSPTQGDISSETEYRLKLDGSHAEEAVRVFAECTRQKNLTIADLPGAKPDHFTDALIRPGIMAALVHSEEKARELGNWLTYVEAPEFPDQWADIETTLDGRSYLRDFKSKFRRDNTDFLSAVITNLRRERAPITDDPIIRFMSYVIMLDLLPWKAREREGYIRKLLGIRR